MKLKTHKTVSKRIRITKKGKVIKRKCGQGHFNSRESATVTRNKRRDLAVSDIYAKNMKRLVGSS